MDQNTLHLNFRRFHIPYFEVLNYCDTCGVLTLQDYRYNRYFIYPSLNRKKPDNNLCEICKHEWPTNVNDVIHPMYEEP